MWYSPPFYLVQKSIFGIIIKVENLFTIFTHPPWASLELQRNQVGKSTPELNLCASHPHEHIHLKSREFHRSFGGYLITPTHADLNYIRLTWMSPIFLLTITKPEAAGPMKFIPLAWLGAKTGFCIYGVQCIQVVQEKHSFCLQNLLWPRQPSWLSLNLESCPLFLSSFQV